MTINSTNPIYLGNHQYLGTDPETGQPRIIWAEDGRIHKIYVGSLNLQNQPHGRGVCYGPDRITIFEQGEYENGIRIPTAAEEPRRTHRAVLDSYIFANCGNEVRQHARAYGQRRNSETSNGESEEEEKSAYLDEQIPNETIQDQIFTGTLPDGRILNGIYTFDGKFEGTITLPDQYTQEGTFVNGDLIEGKITFSNGQIHKGTFINGKLVDGEIKLPNNKILNGTFVDLKITKGTIIFPDRQIHKGTFVNGMLEKGEIRLPNKQILKGTFVDRKLVDGEIKFSDGTIHRGKFINQTLVKGEIESPTGNIKKIDLKSKSSRNK